MTRLDKVLVANRGEIALRVMRACREAGIATVAVYSRPDRAARHVRYADEACEIGPAPAGESYLRPDRIVEAALSAGARAVHPGYGFLAENPRLPRACAEAGLVFIGPSPEVMERVGDKTRARRLAAEAGVPVIPGMSEPISDPGEAARAAAEAGYPVLLKAAGGGGGKGMRVVSSPEELAEAYRRAASEAQAAFHNSDIYLEKFIDRPRHVEFQILADSRGGAVHLNERECSVQRRYQKLVEEAPSPAVDDSLRAEMGEAALRVARTVGYTSAGTVEFLLAPSGEFYFCEMNARLQVEHPLTELVTGVDIVREQLRIAAGEALSLRQEEIRSRGWAIECRIYAEDPDTFLPSTGRILDMVEPSGPGVRLESGVGEGEEISMHYDPMVAKLLAWGRDRPEAVARLRRALGEYVVTGIKTAIPTLLRVLDDPRFLSGKYDTSLIANLGPAPAGDDIEAAALAAAVFVAASRRVSLGGAGEGMKRWRLAGRANEGIRRRDW